MSSGAVKVKNWPFKKEENVKLTWIGEPFKNNNKWMFYAYFKGSNFTKKIELDWATMHFLSVDKYYTYGNLNNGETISNTEVIDINLSGIKAEYKEKDWNISGTGEKTKSKTFNFIKNGILYTMPIIEIIRSIVAPDKFTLNRVVEMDTLENYFIYELNKTKLDIHFTSEYESELLKNEKINHLAWIMTNPNIMKIFNCIGKNLYETNELKFDFLFDRFDIKARIEKKTNYIRILQILALKKKRINVEEVNIFHPSLEGSQLSNDVKKIRKFASKDDEDRELDSNVDGSSRDSELIDTFMISHDYEKLPEINRKKNGLRITRKKEDENTKTYIIEDDKLRTTADTGGEDVIKGLEFTNLDNAKEKGELQEFIEVLKLLEKRQNIKSVDIIVNNLPEGIRGNRFSRLRDGITKRKYAIGKITMINGRENCLIEVEREDKALSMMLLKSNRQIRWEKIYSSLLTSLVEKRGKWCNEVLGKIERSGMYVRRIKHSKKDKYEKEKLMYGKIS